MEILQKGGALTHFQILGEISKQEPNLKQKDLAERLNITIQAVSENIKILTEKGYITSNDGRAPYKITQKGIAKVKKDAIILRKYSDSVLETMTYCHFAFNQGWRIQISRHEACQGNIH